MNAPAEVTQKKRPDELVGLVVGGRYQLLHRLASGGMGSVYAGRAVGAGGFERRLAIKLLHPHLAEREKFVAMFLDEARLAARIHHPNVVSTLDVFEWDGRYYLIMEYVEGLELGRLIHEALKRKSRIPERVALRIVLDALHGLAAAHALTDKHGQPLNLVHRDISPQNILVGADGISRLTDFGVAKAEDRLHVTEGNEFKGKVAYASPEQLDHSIVEQRSDVFAMGVVLYEALTQKRLFKADDKYGIRRMILAGDYPPPSSSDPMLLPLDPIVARAMARELDARTSSAAQFAREIEAVSTSVGGVAMVTEVADWVRAHAADFLADRSEVIHDAESLVPYPTDLGATPPSGLRGSGTSIPAPVENMPDHSEVVPASSHASESLSMDDLMPVSVTSNVEPTRVSRRPSSQSSTPTPAPFDSGVSSASVSVPAPMPAHVAGATATRGFDHGSYTATAGTTATLERDASRRVKATWVLIFVGLAITAAVIGVFVSFALDDEGGANARPTIVPIPSTRPAPTDPVEPTEGVDEAAPTIEEAPTVDVAPTVAAPLEEDTMVFDEADLPAATPATTPAATTMRAREPGRGMRVNMAGADPDPIVEEVENPYRNL